jgi:hypothetical protein
MNPVRQDRRFGGPADLSARFPERALPESRESR